MMAVIGVEGGRVVAVGDKVDGDGFGVRMGWGMRGAWDGEVAEAVFGYWMLLELRVWLGERLGLERKLEV